MANLTAIPTAWRCDSFTSPAGWTIAYRPDHTNLCAELARHLDDGPRLRRRDRRIPLR